MQAVAAGVVEKERAGQEAHHVQRQSLASTPAAAGPENPW